MSSAAPICPLYYQYILFPIFTVIIPSPGDSCKAPGLAYFTVPYRPRCGPDPAPVPTVATPAQAAVPEPFPTGAETAPAGVDPGSPALPRPPPRAGTRSYDHCPSCPPSTPPAAADHAFAVSSPLFQLGAQPGGHRGLGPLTRILMSKCYACKDTAASCCVLARPPGARASVPCSPVLFSCFFSPPSSCFIRSLSRIVSAPARRKNGVPHQLLLRPSLPFP